MSKPDHTLPELEDILQDNPGWLDEAIDTLATWRCRGGGPTFMKLGAAVRYRRRTVLKWLAECEKPQGDATHKRHV